MKSRGTHPIDDLTPFFADHCWMFVILAREAHIAVIPRRGPTEWWRLTLWDTKRDTFEHGQWFRGRIYPTKCDLSPDGKLFVYFAGKFKPSVAAKGYRDTWIAVSRPPYFTALALWPYGGTWGGGSVFVDNRTRNFGGSSGLSGHHPDHPSGPLKSRPDIGAIPSYDVGWRGDAAPRSIPNYSKWTKPCGDFLLGRDVQSADASRSQKLYTLSRTDGEPFALFRSALGRLGSAWPARSRRRRAHRHRQSHERRQTPLA